MNDRGEFTLNILINYIKVGGVAATTDECAAIQGDFEKTRKMC